MTKSPDNRDLLCDCNSGESRVIFVEITCLESAIQDCVECQSDESISSFVLFSKPCSFYGSETPRIMVVGHSPTVRTTEEASVVLKMDKPDQPLYRYIEKSLLEPLGISVSELYCTNIIKCKTKLLPEDISSSVDFFDRAFLKCSRLFEKEVATLKPDLIISLSERVLKLLSKGYMGKELNMKESFAQILYLQISGFCVPYIPIVHIPKGPKSKVAKHYFPEQANRLIGIRARWSMKKYVETKLLEMQSMESMMFSVLTPSMIPEKEGVYCIYHIDGGVPLYVGRTKNLRQRLYNNHLMGPLTNARLKKYLIDDGVVDNLDSAKEYIRKNCCFRWVIEPEMRVRGALEGYMTGVLFPRYGISEEH